MFASLLFVVQVVYSSGLINVVQTTKSTSDRLSRKPTIPWVEDFPSALTLTIDTDKQYQTILGFGGAITEAATLTFSQLNPQLQEEVVQSYYGPHGNQYTLGRVHINSCDFSPKSYSFDESWNDYDLKNFDHNVSHDQETMIPFIKRAIAASTKRGSELKLYATPWSPPAWMKSNYQMTGSNEPAGLIQDDKILNAWAQYLSYFFDAYTAQGVSFWGMTVQNEPEYAAPWEACLYSPEHERDFIKKYLGPIMKTNHPEMKVIIYDHNKDHIAKWADAIFGDSEASQYVWGIGFHWYSGDEFDQLETVHSRWPDKNLLPTEGCNCPGVSINNWTRAELYGHDMLGDLNSWSVGWTDWNILLDSEGGPNHLGNFCDAFIIADIPHQFLHYQPSYYYFGHFSRYLPPRSVHVAHEITVSTTYSDQSLEATAFLTPAGYVVVIVMNRNDSSITFKIKASPSSPTAASITIQAHSILTLSYSKIAK